MDDSINSTSETKWPLIAAVIALTVAALALLFAIKARSDVSKANASLEAAKTELSIVKGEVDAVRLTAAKSSEIAAVDAKVDSFKAEAVGKIDEIIGQISAHKKILDGIKSAPIKASTTAVANGTSTAAAPGEYVVKAGDTPRKIAAANGVAVSDLLKANPGLDPAKLKVGQKIKLPAKAPAKVTAKVQ